MPGTYTSSIFLAIAVVLAGAGIGAGQPSTSPSLIIVNARVFTGAAAAPWADALTIVGERIGAVGTTADLRKLAGPSTRVIDAAGKVVIPGVNDAHVHIDELPPGTPLDGPPAVQQDPDLAAVLSRLKAAIAKTPKGGWIHGDFGERVLDDPRATRFTLDEIAPDHLVALTAWTGHGSLFNTAALRRLGVSDEEPDPPGGVFVRVAGTRKISGLVHEYADYILRRRLTTIPDEKAQVEALRRFGGAAVAFGITSVQWMLTSLPIADAARIAAAADLPLRVRLIDFPMAGMAAWRRPGGRSLKESPRVAISGTKWILDGTPVERLMFLRQPYADRASTRGTMNFPPEQVVGFLRNAQAAREQPMFHAVGDAAIDAVLAALERTGGASWQPRRPRLEHGDMLEPSQFDRARSSGVVLVQNPSHFMLPDVMQRRLGDRTRRVTMMKSMTAGTVPVALGSDGPLNPFLNIMFAVTNANNPGEAMTREQALGGYTYGSAFAEFQETQKGRISPGMLADLAMLSQDIFAVPADALPATSSVLTVVGGRIVHERKSTVEFK